MNSTAMKKGKAVWYEEIDQILRNCCSHCSVFEDMKILIVDCTVWIEMSGIYTKNFIVQYVKQAET